ncbi:Ldh family oxidoreductase [Microtetraspora niveoalba]|uniref:Ldh family oxidoreductase n=1 Tax=Microtetraspora niveoalba TaxID=46175 RepID=UPI000A701033|nr:Ldh family oxidoreductase [Microtetraspora niveoalba]
MNAPTGHDGVVPAHWLRDAVGAVFAAAGFSAGAARDVAEALVEADMRGVASHGTMLVPMYVDRVRAGSVSRREQADVVVDKGAVAVLDAGHALGQLTGDQAMALAVRKARDFGVGAVTVRRAFHFGGAFRYVEAAAREGCVGIAAANTRPLMPAIGGARPVVGNNPLAVGVPVADGAPMVLDMALSEAALGKIRLAGQEGREIPPTWATDAEGRPTTDPAAAIAGMLLPAAGHKGFGLALVVDVLTGVLSGGAFGQGVRGLYADTSVPNDCAHFFLALDVAAFGDPDEFAGRLARLTGEVTGSPTAPGVDRVLLPGQIEAERRAAALAGGVPIGASVLDALRRTAADVGAALPPMPGADDPAGA